MAEAKKKSNSASKSGKKKETDFDAYKRNYSSSKKKAKKDYDAEEENRSEGSFHERTESSDKVKDEIILVVFGLVAILLFLSYLNICGVFGRILNTVCFGFMGCFAYAFPFVMFATAVFVRKAKRRAEGKKRAILCILEMVLIMAFIHVLSVVSLKGSFKIGSTKRRGGGLIGALISYPLYKLLDKIGTVVVLIALIIIILLLLTGKALFHILKQKTKDSYKDISEKHKENKERRERERFERSAEEGRIVYESLNSTESGKPRIYKAEVGPENSYVVPRTVKKKNGSFIERLKNGPDAVESTEEKKSGIFSVPFNFKENKKTDPDEINRQIEEKSKDIYDSEVVEITSEHNGSEYHTKSVYEQEMERKFGGGSGYVKDDNFMPISGQAEDDTFFDNPPVVSNIPAGNTSTVIDNRPKAYIIPAKKTEKEKDKFEAVGVFARGDYRPEGSPEIVSHSLAGKQEIPVSTPVDNAKTAMVVSRGSKPKEKKPYRFPPINLLERPTGNVKGTSKAELDETARKLEDTFKSFGVNVTVNNYSCGPTVTRFELQPEVGVKVSKITSLADDIKLSLAAADIRIEAPIPGKSAVGIEVPNKNNQMVYFSSLVSSDEFKNSKSDLTFAVGKDLAGQVIVTDIAKMPHLLIAGQTGSGKSVCINTLILSIVYKADPEDVKLILVDPKVVELSVYNGLPHLLIPVVTDPKKASGALNWAVTEMTDRYKKFADLGVRKLDEYNKKVTSSSEPIRGSNGEIYEKLPKIVFIIDELADLMMVAPGEVEDYIIRLTQLARACGIHLIVATQRPSVNVITGLIKANVPSRIAFAVAQQVDSRTILDMGGAEKLLGKGDMLFYPAGYTKPVRVQGAFISDTEVSNIVSFVREHNSENDTAEMEEKLNAASVSSPAASSQSSGADAGPDVDELLYKAGKFIIEKEKASIGSLQRQFKIGFNRAARIMDQLSEAGVVGPEEGTKPRQILMSDEVFDAYAAENGLI